MRVFVSAGEASGDAYGAALIEEMQNLSSTELTFEAVGGPRLQASGAKLVTNSTHWGAISIFQALRAVPRVLGGYYRAKRALSKGKPGLFVAIDFGYVNIRFCRHAKNRGWKVVYFIPPASWRRDKQGKDLPVLTDAIATPFSWSAEILRGMGANAHWYGHPIKQLLGDTNPTTDRVTLALLPGSRKHEIEENVPALAEALADWPSLIEFAVAPSADVDSIKGLWPRKEDTFTQGDTYGVLRRAHAAVVCSGTATLEAALCRVPMVIVYRVPKSMEIESKLIGFKQPKYIGLPNILLQRDVVPELVHLDATPQAIRSCVDNLWQDGPQRSRQLQDFDELDTTLGPADAITQTARLALETASE